MSIRKLYEIAMDVDGLLRLVEEADGELTPEIEEAIEDLGMQMREKVDSVMVYRQDVLGDAKKFKAEAERHSENAKTLERTAKSLAGYVLKCLELAGLKSIETERFKKIWRQKNSKAALIFGDEKKVPDDYKIGTLSIPLVSVPTALRAHTVESIDRETIRKDLEAGVELEWAWLEPGEHLRAK